MPVVIVHGASDTIASPAKSRAHTNASVELEEFDGLRHDLFHESRAREVTSFVCDWLDRKLPR
jgi:alpha-beta hydrolase superfamily lysophospholipase